MKIVKSRFFCFVCGILLAIFALSATVSILSPSQALAQSSALELYTIEGTSRAASQGDAVKEITQVVVQKTARDLILEAIGEEKFAQNRKTIETKILAQTPKFIPFVSVGKPARLGDGSWKMPVEMKVSAESLRKMILDAGFLNDENGGVAQLLPMIAVIDRTQGQSLRWWNREGRSTAAHAIIHRIVNDQLAKEFLKQGFVVVKPSVPPAEAPVQQALREPKPDRAALKAIGQSFKVPMILQGDVRITTSKANRDAYNLSLKLKVVRADDGRLIAEVEREIVTKIGSLDQAAKAAFAAHNSEYAKELSLQVTKSWERGKLNANRVRIALRGGLDPKYMGTFKSGLVSRFREIKDVKERIFEKNQVVLEVDYTGGLKDLALKLKSAQLPGFNTRLTQATTKTLTLDVRPSIQ